ncbi:MAG: MFS transporter [Acidimicrobiaceae bacterium]|nr:MFS transporter [Acidimicrobiaceae bacterium]
MTGTAGGEPTRPVASLVSSVSSQTAAMFPAFAVGALALPMGDDLGFSEAGLGSAVAFFFLLAAVTSPHAGTLTDRLGPQRSLRVANLCSCSALLVAALVVQSYWVLLAALGIGAIGLTIAGPGTKTMVARGTDIRRHGLFFGIQAAAVPLSVFLAGLAVPAIGSTLGWRWAFGFAVVVPLTGLLTAPPYRARPGHVVRTEGAARGLSKIDYGPLNLIGLAAALGSAAATTMAAFFVSAATDAGLAEGLAGGLLAVASGLPIATRIAAGYLADRFESGHLRVVSLLLGTSTLGYLAAATGSKVLVPAGAMFALGVGWAWSGLMVHSVIRAYRDSPGAATGMTSGGLNVGGVVGPFAFGLLADRVSYTAGFLTIAACALLAALAADAGRRRLIRAGANP